ncbi:MAG: hypothetical protein V5A62_00225 [Haloarculaceae archaeon]
MEEPRVRTLRFLALQVVGAVAVVHLVVGGETLLAVLARGLLGTYLTEFVVADPRPLLFVGSALATFGGIVAVARGRLDHRRAYLLGIALLLGYVLGWIAWHTVLDHGLALGGGTPTPTPDGHSHGGLLETLRSHYLEPLVATVTASTAGTPGTGRTLLGVVSASLELVGVALLATLLRVDPAARREGSHNPFARGGDSDPVAESGGATATDHEGGPEAEREREGEREPERVG